jgi:hypothetical protein
VTYQDRVRFAEKLRKMTPDQLGEVTSMLQRVCPPAFQEVDDEKAQILVDNIDIVSFRELMDMIDNI